MPTATTNKERFEELDRYIADLPDRNGALIQVLHVAQDLFGYLPEDVQMHVARRLGLPAAKVYGVVTFYSFFNMEPRGQFTVSVCLGTACFVRGSEEIMREFEQQLKVKCGATTPDNLFTLTSIRCVGACGLAPVVMVNGRIFGRVTAKDVASIIDEYMAKGGAGDGETQVAR